MYEYTRVTEYQLIDNNRGKLVLFIQVEGIKGRGSKRARTE